jgi:hypothetical protein
MNFVKVGNRYINLDNVAEVVAKDSSAVITYNSGNNDDTLFTTLSPAQAAEFLAILDKIASANWFVPVEKAQPEITPVYDVDGNELPF